MIKNTIKAIPLITKDSTTINNSYQPVNPAGLPNSVYKLIIINGSTQSIEISYDGVTDHDVVFAATQKDITGPIAVFPNFPQGYFPKGLIIYVKGTAGAGTVGIAGYYQPVS